MTAMFPVQTHLKMLADRTRMAAYKKGIFDNIRPGDTVADIGTGTGILAFFALQAGAARVYALESGDIIETARKMATDNGFAERIVFIAADSREARLPDKVDAIVTETFGGLGFDEGTIDLLADARERFLKPGGRLLPERMNLWALPVHFDSGHPFAPVNDTLEDLETGSLMQLAVNAGYGLRACDLDHCKQLGKPGRLLAVDFLNCRPMMFPFKMRTPEIELGPGSYDGVVVCPELVFPGESSLSFFDGGQFVPTHWELVFLPVQESIRMDSAGSLVFHLTVTEQNGLVWKHVVTHAGQRKAFTHLSAFGLPSLKKIVPG